MSIDKNISLEVRKEKKMSSFCFACFLGSPEQSKPERLEHQQQEAAVPEDEVRPRNSVTQISTEIDARRDPLPRNHHQNAVQSEARSSGPRSSLSAPSSSSRNPVRSVGLIMPCVGTWVVVATPAVMVFSGRATAIICLCSCLYFLPSYGGQPWWKTWYR
ncbi:hypothetical protein BHE74_00053993 [Ensete ventricosum]|nr:hypothetical protein BHE74_00053993 [Ensete ventricosum]RZR87219.1 hypothetical protein BHM03_00014581 [Ensete ventricosum]